MKSCLLIAVFFVLLFTGCDNGKAGTGAIPSPQDSIGAALTDLAYSKDIKKLLCQDWENKDDAESAALTGRSGNLEIPFRGLSFFEDSTVVESPRDNIRFGKWSMNDVNKMIGIEFSNGAKMQYKIVAIGARQMILMNMKDKKRTEYRADAKMQKDPADDPFHRSNNEWRIKPGHAESDSAIKLRTEQCVLFYSKFLDDNANRGGNTISFVGLPTCFKWYRGAVTVTAKDKLDVKWLNCYYNKEQAWRAQAMLESIISKKYKWNKEEKNWVRQSAEVIKQIYDTLRLL